VNIPDLDKLPPYALLTPKQVAAILNVSPHTLTYWRSQKRNAGLKWVRIEKAPRYRVSDVRAYLGMNSTAAE
jgi:transposase-like protein